MNAAPATVGPGVAAASAASARVAELHKLIEEVEVGGETAPSSSSSFGARLAAATAASGQATADPQATASLLSGAGSGEAALGTAGAPPFANQIETACARYGVDPSLLAGLVHAESNFDPSAGSAAGAQGLTQLMPSTAHSLGVTDPCDPAQAIEGGARLLSEKLREFGGNPELALAAYNAGSGAVHQYNGIPPYPETQAYVKRVLGYAGEYARGGAFGDS